MKELNLACNNYYVACCLFLDLSLTHWTVGHVIPHHATKIFNMYGLGLGLCTMQGREAKHIQLKEYLVHCAGVSRELKWVNVMKHEYAELILLLELDPASDRYRRREDQSVPKRERIMPTVIEHSLHCRSCMTVVERGDECSICSSPLMSFVKQSVSMKKIHPKLCH